MLTKSRKDVYRNIVAARETDVRLVVVGGQARYGIRPIMKALAPNPTDCRIGRLARAIDYGNADLTWKSTLADLERVRSDPVQAAQRADSALSALAAGDDAFILLPDMPSPETGGVTLEAPGPVDVPPLEPLTPTMAWFNQVDANPWPRGLLSKLRNYA